MKKCKQDYCVVLNFQGETTWLPWKHKHSFYTFMSRINVPDRLFKFGTSDSTVSRVHVYFIFHYFFPNLLSILFNCENKLFWMQFLIYPFILDYIFKSCSIAQVLNTYFSHKAGYLPFLYSLKTERNKTEKCIHFEFK